jgi:hypothetical protein
MAQIALVIGGRKAIGNEAVAVRQVESSEKHGAGDEFTK